MPRKFKYVILGGCFPVIFSEANNHSDFKDIGSIGRPTSAGFAELQFNDGVLSVQVWGESVSLNLKSNPAEDCYLIERLFTERY